MKIIAEYTEPKYYHYRKLVGINTYANRSEPDGFETRYIYAQSIEELAFIIKNKTFRNSHVGLGRPMSLSDLTIKIEEGSHE